MTEPEIREHVEQEHGWTRLNSFAMTYFGTLDAHLQEHRKERMQVVR